MARTTATNFSGGLQFPYATAATDLFKKEDVQTLALAVDQHTHASGLGLPIATIPASAIGTGLITSAMIADGTIVAGDIADNTITSAKILDGTLGFADMAAHAVSATYISPGVTVTPSTTSLVPVDMPEMVYTFPMSSTGDLRIFFTASVIVGAGTYAIFNLLLDGAGLITGYVQSTAINVTVNLAYMVIGAAQTNHTAKVQWYLGAAGSLSASSTARMIGIEVHYR